MLFATHVVQLDGQATHVLVFPTRACWGGHATTARAKVSRCMRTHEACRKSSARMQAASLRGLWRSTALWATQRGYSYACHACEAGVGPGRHPMQTDSGRPEPDGCGRSRHFGTSTHRNGLTRSGSRRCRGCSSCRCTPCNLPGRMQESVRRWDAMKGHILGEIAPAALMCEASARGRGWHTCANGG